MRAVGGLAFTQLIAFAVCSFHGVFFAPELRPGFTDFEVGESMRYFPPTTNSSGGGGDDDNDDDFVCDILGYPPPLSTSSVGVCAGNVSVAVANRSKNFEYACTAVNLTGVGGETIISAYDLELLQYVVGATQVALSYGLVFFEGVTIPVGLMILNLPFRVYVLLVMIPTATSLPLAVTRFVLAVLEPNEALEAVAGNIIQALVALLACVGIVVVSVSSVFSVYNQERGWRSLFVLHAAQRTKHRRLEHDAVYRGYRDTLQANRAEFATTAAASTMVTTTGHYTAAATATTTRAAQVDGKHGGGGAHIGKFATIN